jgi:hypothetical protein
MRVIVRVMIYVGADRDMDIWTYWDVEIFWEDDGNCNCEKSFSVSYFSAN